MKKQKITMSECLVWGFVVLIIAMISVSAYLSTKTVTEQEKPATEQKKLYEDDGAGVMIMKEYNIYTLKKGYLQWKKDYPKRAQKIVASTTSGGGGSYFMLIYGTE